MSDLYFQNQFLRGFRSVNIVYQRRQPYLKKQRASTMDRDELAGFVQDSVHSAIGQSKNEILTGVQQLISSEMKKVTESQKALSDLQISKIADLSSDYKFKRRSNEEQFKVNKKVLGQLDDCERNLDLNEMDKARENLAEGKSRFIA